MVKVTFTFDDATVATLRRSAARVRKPRSAVVREAIALYAERVDQLSAGERAAMLRALDALIATPTRPAAQVDAELAAVRASRHAAGRRRSR